MSRLNNLCSMMIEFYRDDPARIQHFIKVHSFAKLIGEEEHLDEKLLYILEAAAYVYISDKLTILHGQSDHLSRRFRSLISERDSRRSKSFL